MEIYSPTGSKIIAKRLFYRQERDITGNPEDDAVTLTYKNDTEQTVYLSKKIRRASKPLYGYRKDVPLDGPYRWSDAELTLWKDDEVSPRGHQLFTPQRFPVRYEVSLQAVNLLLIPDNQRPNVTHKGKLLPFQATSEHQQTLGETFYIHTTIGLYKPAPWVDENSELWTEDDLTFKE